MTPKQYEAMNKVFDLLGEARNTMPFNCDLKDDIGRLMDRADEMLTSADRTGLNNV